MMHKWMVCGLRMKRVSDFQIPDEPSLLITSTASATSEQTKLSDVDLLAQLDATSSRVASRDPRVAQRAGRKERAETAGAGWFHLPRQKLTDELKSDFKMIAFRGYMDPRRFYKKERGLIPKHFHVGTVVEGAADYYSGRLARKDRTDSITADVLSDPKTRQYLRRKLVEVSNASRSKRLKLTPSKTNAFNKPSQLRQAKKSRQSTLKKVRAGL